MNSSKSTADRGVAVIGGGPAGLMAAEVLAQGGVQVHLYDAMPSVGRKFLLAGKGGMNITHSEPIEQFYTRYGTRRTQLEAMLNVFGPEHLRGWVQDLGLDTFVGSSGKVFPTDMKAAPLLRAWLHRLRVMGVHFHMRHRWCGWGREGALIFETPEEELTVEADAVVLALGGGSWSRLGSNGAWVSLLHERGIGVVPLRPANCGFDIGWTEHFHSRFAGLPVKPVVVTFTNSQGVMLRKQGEFIVTATGVEGSLIYALSSALREEIVINGSATIYLDLMPDKDMEHVCREVSQPRGSRSWASHLQSRLGLKGVKVGLLREIVSTQGFADPLLLATVIKALPLRLMVPRPIDEAISSAGGVSFDGVNEHLMCSSMPGVFCAGEMLDWEAPTGGYLLTACFASGHAAGRGALAWLGVGAE